MEERLWSMTQQARILQEYRKDIDRIWNDSVAHELNSRYLNPHEVTVQDIKTHLHNHQNILAQISQKITSCQTYRHEINQLAQEITSLLDLISTNVKDAHSYYDFFKAQNEEAKSKFPFIQELIKQANNMCD